MSRLIALDWEADDLGVVEADVAGGSVRVRRCTQYDWPEEGGAGGDPQALAPWLKTTLHRDRLSGGEAIVVLPREAVVVRRLDVPDVPDEELPDLVRFQAATKSSTPLEKLALDFLPLRAQEGHEGRQVLMVTVDKSRVDGIREALRAADLELRAVGISSVAMAEVVTRIPGEHTSDPQHASLIIFQDARRIEITILRQQQIIFTHETRLQGETADRGLKASLSEVNRSTVALSHSHPDVAIAEVCLIHSGDADPAFEAALKERFGGRLHVLDVAGARGLRVDRDEDRRQLASFAPAVGMLLSTDGGQVPRIDFLNPRRAVVAPDRTKLWIGLAAAGVLLAGGIGYGLFRSHLGGMREQIAGMQTKAADLDLALKAGEDDLAADAQVGGWVAGGAHPLVLMQDLQELSPGRDRAYWKQFNVNPPGRDNIVHLSGTGFARSDDDVDDLYYRLDSAGYRVQPALTKAGPNPDYPVEFDLEIDVLPPKPAAEDEQTPQPSVAPGSG